MKKIVDCLSFGDFGNKGVYDTKVKGFGLDFLVSEEQTSLLKTKEVSTSIPTVAKETQGEVVMFASKAVTILQENGYTSLVEGREQTVDYIPTNFRYRLIMSDSGLIGMRRTAQRIGGTVVKSLDGKTDVSEDDIKKLLTEELNKLAGNSTEGKKSSDMTDLLKTLRAKFDELDEGKSGTVDIDELATAFEIDKSLKTAISEAGLNSEWYMATSDDSSENFTWDDFLKALGVQSTNEEDSKSKKEAVDASNEDGRIPFLDVLSSFDCGSEKEETESKKTSSNVYANVLVAMKINEKVPENNKTADVLYRIHAWQVLIAMEVVASVPEKENNIKINAKVPGNNKAAPDALYAIHAWQILMAMEVVSSEKPQPQTDSEFRGLLRARHLV
eukprot:UN26589